MDRERKLTARLVRAATFAAVRGAATATGTGVVTLVIWWITHH